MSCAATPYGWFLYACEKRSEAPAISDVLWTLMAKARRQGAEHLLFDRDAVVLGHLPAFDDAASTTPEPSPEHDAALVGHTVLHSWLH